MLGTIRPLFIALLCTGTRETTRLLLGYSNTSLAQAWNPHISTFFSSQIIIHTLQ